MFSMSGMAESKEKESRNICQRCIWTGFEVKSTGMPLLTYCMGSAPFSGSERYSFDCFDRYSIAGVLTPFAWSGNGWSNMNLALTLPTSARYRATSINGMILTDIHFFEYRKMVPT